MMINEDYFIKYLKNELTEEETRQLIAWVKEKKENPEVQKRTVFLNNISFNATEEQIREYFGKFGTITEVTIVCNEKVAQIMEQFFDFDVRARLHLVAEGDTFCTGAFLPLRRCCRGRCLRGLAGQCLLLWYQFICGAGYSGNRSRTAGQDCAARWLYGVAERLFQTDLFIGGVAESTRCTAGGRSDIRCEA